MTPRSNFNRKSPKRYHPVSERTKAIRAQQKGLGQGIDTQTVAKVMEVYAKFTKLFNDPKRRAKNVRQLKAHCTRPECGGMINAVLAGPKRHLHFACSNTNCYYRAMT